MKAASPLIYVDGAERMVTAARLTEDAVFVRFADDREGRIPLAELTLPAAPTGVSLPRPHCIEIRLENGNTTEVPWDFARHFVDESHEVRSRAAATAGRRRFGARLRRLRSKRRMTQRELATKAEISRITVARIESGKTLPRYQTLSALALALELPVERLLVEGE